MTLEAGGARAARRRALFGATALAVTGVVGAARPSDRLDSPSVIADPLSDLNDLYTFTSGGRFVMVLTLVPGATSTSQFGTHRQYVFHTSSGAYPTTTADETFICTFDVAQKISCWAGTDDYVTGDASSPAGITSASGKMQVFAGERADPFFYDLQGYKDAVANVKAAAASFTFDTSGCPQVTPATSSVITGTLAETTSSNAPSKTTADDFGTSNVLAITLSVDMSLVTKGGAVVAVWASTNVGS